MAIIHDFAYYKPKELSNILELLNKHKESAKILAGGTDLVVHLKENLIEPDVLIDIKGVDELNNIQEQENEIFIGSGVTFSQLIESPIIKKHLPLLLDASKTVASVGIRNRATLVGNICSAVPSADSAPPLLVYDAEIFVKSHKESKTISVHDWFVSPKKTVLEPNELVIGIKIPKCSHVGVYEKLGRYRGEDLAQAGLSILFTQDKEIRLASCAVGPIPIRMKKIEEFLNKQKLTNEVLKKAKSMIADSISPITDIRSTKEYRIHMMQTMFERGIEKCLAKMKGEVS